MSLIAHIGGTVTGFNVTDRHIDCMSGKELIKIDKHSQKIIFRKTVFEKEGLSRKFIADNGQIIIYDFCTLYILNQNDYELISKWQLGNDLSSDICGIAADKDTVYCSVRNGKIVTLDRRSQLLKEYVISENSMWCIKVYNSYLLCGTVDGKLLQLDKKSMSVVKSLALGKKIIGSLYIEGETLYAAGHDGKLFRIDLETFEVEAMAKKAHRKMFFCTGTYKDMLVTVCFPCSEIAFWNKDTLEKTREINTPLALSGCTYIEDDFMYISSRNISGIEKIKLDLE